jgi:hypothetical protein
MPHIENVTQIIIRTLVWLTMKEKQAVTGEYRPRCQQAAKKTKPALLDEFTRLTGYHQIPEVAGKGTLPAARFSPSAALSIAKKQEMNRL